MSIISKLSKKQVFTLYEIRGVLFYAGLFIDSYTMNGLVIDVYKTPLNCTISLGDGYKLVM